MYNTRFAHTHDFSWCSQRARDTALYGLQSVPPPLTATYSEPRLLLLMRPFMTIHEESSTKSKEMDVKESNNERKRKRDEEGNGEEDDDA